MCALPLDITLLTLTCLTSIKRERRATLQVAYRPRHRYKRCDAVEYCEELTLTPYESLWLSAFIKTQLIEVSLGLLLLFTLSTRGRLSTPLSLPRDLLVLFIASSITHPPLWFVLPTLCRQWGVSYEGYVAIGEGLVVLCEGLWYRATLRPLGGRASLSLLLSLALNTVSASIGLIFR